MLQEYEYGVKEYKGVPVVSSRKIAEVFEKEHKNVLQAIEEQLKSLGNFAAEFSAANFLKKTYRNRGRQYPEYLLTKDGFAYVVMGFTGEKASKFKIAYITQYNQMESEITYREQAKADFPELTWAVKMANPNAESYHYARECDLLNKAILGMSAKKFKDINGINPKESSIRPYLNEEQLYLLNRFQKMVTGFIMSGVSFEERRDRIVGIKEACLTAFYQKKAKELEKQKRRGLYA